MSKVYLHVCPQCCVEFNSRSETSECCSRPCATRYQRAHHKDPVVPVARHCTRCGVTFISPFKNQKFCCRACYFKTYKSTVPTRGTTDGNGYRCVCVGGKRILEHRYVMEHYIGRPLRTEEQVHHIDGVRTNNDISNLELFASLSDHQRFAHGAIATETHRMCLGCLSLKPREEFGIVNKSIGNPKLEKNRARCKECTKKYSSKARKAAL